MAIGNYTELQAAVAGWLNRTDLTARIPEFITIGESKINRKLRTLDQQVTEDVSLVAEYLDMPADWAQTANIASDTVDGLEIEYVTPQRFIKERCFHAPSGKPRVYTLEGRRMRFAPVPDGPQAAVHSYYRRVPPLSDAAPTNWLLTSHSDIYLSAALLAANTFLRDMEGVTLATAELADGIGSLVQADQGDRTNTTPRSQAQPIG